MCRHFTHFSFSICSHTYPIPQAFPFYVPPQYCSTVTDALNFYHTQPDRMPEQFPIPFPKPCPIETAENITVEVLGLCEPCAVEEERRERYVEAPTGRGGRGDEGGTGQGPSGERERERERKPEGASADAGRNQRQKPSSGGRQPANEPAPADKMTGGEVEDDAILAKGPVIRATKKSPLIVTTPELVGAWYPDGPSLKCEGWTTDKTGKRQTKLWTIRAGVSA